MSVEKASATSTHRRYEFLKEIMVRGIWFPRYRRPAIKPPRQKPKCDAADALVYENLDRKWLWFEELDDFQREIDSYRFDPKAEGVGIDIARYGLELTPPQWFRKEQDKCRR